MVIFPILAFVFDPRPMWWRDSMLPWISGVQSCHESITVWLQRPGYQKTIVLMGQWSSDPPSRRWESEGSKATMNESPEWSTRGHHTERPELEVLEQRKGNSPSSSLNPASPHPWLSQLQSLWICESNRRCEKRQPPITFHNGCSSCTNLISSVSTQTCYWWVFLAPKSLYLQWTHPSLHFPESKLLSLTNALAVWLSQLPYHTHTRQFWPWVFCTGYQVYQRSQISVCIVITCFIRIPLILTFLSLYHFLTSLAFWVLLYLRLSPN